jgi:hypothetical protein
MTSFVDYSMLDCLLLEFFPSSKSYNTRKLMSLYPKCLYLGIQSFFVFAHRLKIHSP